jgi:hypothetical protein
MTLTIPPKGIATRSRRPKYIPATAATVIVTVNAGTPQSFALSGPNCATAASGTVCTLSVAAPIGSNDVFEIQIEDANGSVVAAGTLTTAILEGQNNVTVPIVLEGVPAFVDIASSNTVGTIFTLGGGAQTALLTATVRDQDLNIIIGNDPFVNASGAATPIELTSVAGPSIQYATAPAGGSFGAASSTIVLNAPSDQLEMQFTGSGVPPGYDSLTIASPAGVESNAYGTTPQPVGIGVAWHAPFVPLSVAPIAAGVAAAAGVPHSAVVTDGVNHLAIVGSGSCTAPNLPATVTAISSIAVDGGASPADENVYAVLSGSTPETDLVNYSLAAIGSGTCSQTHQSNYSSTLAATGIVRAANGNIVYFLNNATNAGATTTPTLEASTDTAPGSFTGGSLTTNPIGGLAFDGSHIFTCQNQNGGSDILIEEFDLPLAATPVRSSFASASATADLCAGIAIDTTSTFVGLVAQNDTMVTTYGTAPISDQSFFSLSGTTLAGLQPIDNQGFAAGNYFRLRAFFILASDGIEVWNEQPSFVEPAVISLSRSTLPSAVTTGSISAMEFGDDQRLWITLSSGYVVGLPTY